MVPLVLLVAAMTGCAAAPAEEVSTASRTPRDRRPFAPPPHGIAAFPVLPSLPLVEPVGMPEASATNVAAEESASVDAKVLILSPEVKGKDDDVQLGAIVQGLQFIGIPYEVRDLSKQPGLTADQLSTGSHGNYNGIILTNGALSYSKDGTTFVSALSPAEWTTLWNYEARFGVRQVGWYTYPRPDVGFAAGAVPRSTTPPEAPLRGTLTDAGRAEFPYLSPTAVVSIKLAYAYLAKPLDANTTPLVVDDAGNALVAVKKYPDGREALSMTFDSSKYLEHGVYMSFGVASWVTRGLFLGERHVYLDPQIDDLFIADDIWLALGVPPYRITGTDLEAVTAWQRARQAQKNTKELRLTQVFNGSGVLTDAPAGDTLVPAVRRLKDEYKWINHTFNHANLDNVSYDFVYDELRSNDQIGHMFGFSRFNGKSVVCPDVSGLKMPDTMRAFYDLGIRYLVSDTSRAGEDNPTPNAPILNWLQPGVLMLPRRPNNLFYNITTPSQEVAEYNELYRAYWKSKGVRDGNLNYDEILDQEAGTLVQYLFKGEIDPWMFHQTNLRAYDAMGHTTLTDILDRILTKYSDVYDLPILSPLQSETGKKMEDRMDYNASGVSAVIQGGKSIKITVKQSATIPVTGLKSKNAEIYGKQPITYVRLCSGDTVTLPLDGSADVPPPETKVCPPNPRIPVRVP